MSEEKNMQKIDNNSLKNASGGFAGRDSFSQSEYNKAGVSHQKNIWSKDQYWYRGKEIDQKTAEAIVIAYMCNKGKN